MKLPTQIGDATNFDAHGRRFYLKRLSRNSWYLATCDNPTRSRFGDRAQIADDIAHVAATGHMPSRSKRPWS